MTDDAPLPPSPPRSLPEVTVTMLTLARVYVTLSRLCAGRVFPSRMAGIYAHKRGCFGRSCDVRSNMLQAVAGP